jgi:hypothetical protein
LKQLLKNLINSNLYLLLAAIGLFAASFFLNKYVVGTTSASYYAIRIQQDIRQKENDFRILTADTALLRSLINQSYSQHTLKELLDDEKGYGFFIYEKTGLGDPRLLFWNNQLAIPPLNLMDESDVSRLVTLNNGFYVHTSKMVVIDNHSYAVEALIPVMWKYFVEIENLKREFASFPEARKRVDISFTPDRLCNKKLLREYSFLSQSDKYPPSAKQLVDRALRTCRHILVILVCALRRPCDCGEKRIMVGRDIPFSCDWIVEIGYLLLSRNPGSASIRTFRSCDLRVQFCIEFAGRSVY